MGIVRRESIRSTIFSYIGIVIGFISQTFIFTNLLSAQLVGLIRVIQSFAGLQAEVGQLSIQTTTGRFFPYFRNKESSHHGFLSLAVLLTSFGFILVFFLTLIFRNNIILWYNEQSPLFAQKFYYAFPIALALIYITVFESYLRMLYRIIFSTIVKEIYIRLFALGAVLLYYFKVVDIDGFLIVFAGTYALAAFSMIVYLRIIGEWHFRLDFSLLKKDFLKEIRQYTAYTYITILVHRGILEMDKIFIAAMNGLGAAGIYSVTSLMASVISMPVNAIGNISISFISEAFKVNDMVKVKEIYHKASLNQFIASSLLFLLIWHNADNFFSFMPAEYSAGKIIILLIGIAKLTDAICANSNSIILLSNYYSFMMFSGSFILAFLIAANIFFIRLMGISGAALAILTSVVLHNALKVGFVWWKIGIHPFNKNLFKACFVFLLSFLIFELIPIFEFVIFDIIFRTIGISVLFVGMILFFKVSEEIDILKRDLINRITTRNYKTFKE